MKHLLFIAIIFISASSYSQVYLDISVDQAKDTIAAYAGNNHFTILDVRTVSEYIPEHIEGAFNRDFYATDLKLQLDSLDKSRVFLIYCRSGNRSGQTLSMMEDLGFQTVYNMLGGMNDWNAANYPVTDVIPPYVDIYQNTTNLDELKSAELSVFPNPTMQTITLELSEKHLAQATFKVISQDGKVVLQGTLNQALVVDVSLLNNGVYNLLLFKDNQSFHSSSIIKL